MTGVVKGYLRRVLGAWMALGHVVSDVRFAWVSDPALRGKPLAFLELLTYPGLWAVFFHRVAHALHVTGLPVVPRVLSQASRFLTGVDIHPGAVLGRGVFIDHGHGVVIGETAVVGSFVLIYHQVTLGNAHAVTGKRHPTIGDRVVLGAGALVLGPINVGDWAVVGAGSVVHTSVPAHSVVVGTPARIVRRHGLPVHTPQTGVGSA